MNVYNVSPYYLQYNRYFRYIGVEEFQNVYTQRNKKKNMMLLMMMMKKETKVNK